jgi:tetratricopeptide (TPR) repeat protein
MLGGNLGTLTGDYLFARRWLIRSIKFAKNYNYMDYLCRSYRKYADILRYNGHIKWANKLCNLALNIAHDEGYRRYEIYLMCSKAEICRKNGALSESIKLYEKAQIEAKKLGIKGWIGHTMLGIAENMFCKKNTTEALGYFNKAGNIYIEIGQVWGLIQTNIGKSKCLYVSGQEWKALLESTREESHRMGYKKDESLITKMLSESPLIYNDLMFL